MTPKPEAELKALLLVELAERFERGQIIGATRYSLRCADALRWAYGNTLTRPSTEPASVPGDVSRLLDQIQFQVESIVCATDETHSVYPETDHISEWIDQVRALLAAVPVVEGK